MHRGLYAAVAAGVGVSLMMMSGPVRADVTVIGGGFAQSCSEQAKAAARTQRPFSESIRECTLAIDDEILSAHDRAATYVNRGVLYLILSNWSAAQSDFDQAMAIEPKLAEAWVNRGATMIAEGHDEEAISDIDKGLGLDTTEPEKAYFNRALAKERLNDLKGAYEDYQKALALKPDWAMPQAELTRFHVVQR